MSGNNKKHKKPSNKTHNPTVNPTVDTITQTFSTLMQELAKNCQGTLGLGIQKIAGEISVGAFLEQCIYNIPHGLESLPADLQNIFNNALNNTDIYNSTINLEELSNLTYSFNSRGLSDAETDPNNYKYLALGAIALLTTAMPLVVAGLTNKGPLTYFYKTKDADSKTTPLSSSPKTTPHP